MMLTARTGLSSFLMWETIYHVLTLAVPALLSTPFAHRHLPDAKRRTHLATHLPSYILSTLHALYVVPRGAQHLLRLFRAPIQLKLHYPPLFSAVSGYSPGAHELRYLAETRRVLSTNVTLTGYLLCDLLHVLRRYPLLGGADIVAHHAVFLSCALVAGRYSLHPFMFGWLILGELSTLFLNLRWLLIHTGHASGALFKAVQTMFAVTFAVTRFFMYGVGLAYQLNLLPYMPEYIPSWAAMSTISVVVVGFFLNMVWLVKIVRIAMAPNKHRVSSQSTNSSTSTAQRRRAQSLQEREQQEQQRTKVE